MSYKHGITGELAPTENVVLPSGVSTLPVYIGTAPVDSLQDYTGAVNVPILVKSFEDAKTKLGYSDEWEKYTLCEAMHAHFKNSIGNIGPVVMINVFDPDTHTLISDVSASDIVGDVETDGTRKGIACVDLVYQMFNMVPSILAAPGWSQLPDVEAALVSKCQKINGHWDAICVVDIDSSTASSVAASVTWKATNSYTSRLEKVCWPKVENGEREFWLSTMAVVRMQQTDYDNGNVPYESPSNKPIMASGTVLDNGTPILFDSIEANTLNASGITTAVFRSGNWVLWGPHNANYAYGSEIDARDMFDCGIRMMMYLTNEFQNRYMADIDAPLNRSRVDTILNSAQNWLNSLVADGKVLFAQISFIEDSNPVSSIVQGEFVFDVATTTTPPGKSLTFRVQYTADGINALLDGGEAG